jgi:hypothetical protein
VIRASIAGGEPWGAIPRITRVFSMHIGLTISPRARRASGRRACAGNGGRPFRRILDEESRLRNAGIAQDGDSTGAITSSS